MTTKLDKYCKYDRLQDVRKNKKRVLAARFKETSFISRRENILNGKQLYRYLKTMNQL
ncbi:hypothetical protein GCM10010913_24590 [Paenibacillus aceti]|uniref:Uncharacterized protein n=1 Tax=Paenibacillus aceti TaxID=1820010 RepID=A0ABQ1VVW4_9BACL|nr:hypothetical protein GCM10010913_24590 [Paenibacillus aceti]